MKLFMVGMGIANLGSMTLRGLEAVMESDEVFAELFTSLLERDTISGLENKTGVKVNLLGRSQLEEEELIIKSLEKGNDVCFLTAGDPLAATTHQELRIDAEDMGAEVEIVNSSSIFTAAPGLAGLQQYKFGRTTTIPYPEGDYLPTSPAEVILENIKAGLHTLVLLDIQAHRGRYMSVREGAGIILRMVEEAGLEGIGGSTKAVGVARVGRKDHRVIYCDLSSLKEIDLGGPPHCLMIPGSLHFMEEEILERYRI